MPDARLQRTRDAYREATTIDIPRRLVIPYSLTWAGIKVSPELHGIFGAAHLPDATGDSEETEPGGVGICLSACKSRTTW
jgi:hypothetical protein